MQEKMLKTGVLVSLAIFLIVAIIAVFANAMQNQSVAVTGTSNSSSERTATTTTATVVSTSTQNSCIITLYTVKYEVSVYRNLHSGGDIFVCNSDMTQEFEHEHWMKKAAYLAMLSVYKISQ